MMKILLSTNNHLGDTVALTAALCNARGVFPEVEFDYEGNYPGVFFNNSCIRHFNHNFADVIRFKICYSPFSQRTGNGGNLCEAYSKNLSRMMQDVIGHGFDMSREIPYIILTDDERNMYRDLGKYVVINANCQKCSEVKRYPHWQKIIDSCPDLKFVQIGGKESRDISTELSNVIDLRGQTSVRQLFALISKAQRVISPASAVVHIAAAFGIPTICLIGARESYRLTDYQNVKHLHSKCGNFDSSNGCMKFYMRGDSKSCLKPVSIDDNYFPQCMYDISAEEVLECL